MIVRCNVFFFFLETISNYKITLVFTTVDTPLVKSLFCNKSNVFYTSIFHPNVKNKIFLFFSLHMIKQSPNYLHYKHPTYMLLK